MTERLTNAIVHSIAVKPVIDHQTCSNSLEEFFR
jgi:hypothetical protein